MFDTIRNFFSADSTLPPPEDPKVKKGGLSVPSFLRQAKPSKTTPLPLTDRRLINTDLTTMRTGASTYAVVREFVAASPDLSAAVWAYVRNCVTQDMSAIGKNRDNTFNAEATALAQQFIVNFNVLGNYGGGYTWAPSIVSLAESLVKELLQYGSCSAELILDKSYVPIRIQPVSVTNVKFLPDDKGVLKPQQTIGSTTTDLDTPAYVYVALDQDLLEPYSNSPLEASLQPALFSTEFINDVRKVIQKVLHPRMFATLSEERLKTYLTVAAQHDPALRKTEIDAIVEGIKNSINNLEPEDALVLLDSVKVDLLNNGNTSLSDEYKIVKEISDAKLATGAKTMPAILGHGSASSNVASTETLLFMKSVLGVQAKINELFSKLFTLAVRLLGQDAYIEFKFAEVDLRPKSELEAFKAVKQSRILELLSLGLMTDEEACIELTGKLPPAGYKPLTGTMFKAGANSGVGNAASGSPTGGDTGQGDQSKSNDGSTMNKNLNSDAPKGVKSQNNKSKG